MKFLCLPFVGSLHGDIHNFTSVLPERSIYARQARSLQNTMERMRTSSFALPRKIKFHRISHEQAQTSIHAFSKKLIFP